jgi:hypothetical protein
MVEPKKNEKKETEILLEEYMSQTKQDDKHDYSITISDHSDGGCCCC